MVYYDKDIDCIIELELEVMVFNHTAEIVTNMTLQIILSYNLILGRDIIHELGLIFYFENNTINWQEVSIPMKPSDCMGK